MADERTYVVRLDAAVDGYTTSMDRAAAASDKVAASAKRTSDEVSKGHERQRRSLMTYFAEHEKSFQAMERSGRALTKSITLPMVALGGAIVATGVSYNALEQRSRAALTTVLGSTEAAADQMERLREFVRDSPFPRQAFIQAQQQLLGFGMQAERVVPVLNAVQDAVAATGGSSQDILEVVDVLARIEGQGKITGMELQRLGIRGIDAAGMIGDALGMTVEDTRAAISDSAIDADTAIDALVAGIDQRMGGAAERVKETWVGATDRIAGAFRDLSSVIIEPFIDPTGGGLAVGGANWVADRIRDLEGAMRELPPAARVATVGVAGLVAGVGPALWGLGKLGQAVVNTKKNFREMRPVMSDAAAFLRGPWGIALGAATAAFVAFTWTMNAGRGAAREWAEELQGGFAQGFDTSTASGQIDSLQAQVEGISDAMAELEALATDRSVGAMAADIAGAVPGITSASREARLRFQELGKGLEDLQVEVRNAEGIVNEAWHRIIFELGQDVPLDGIVAAADALGLDLASAAREEAVPAIVAFIEGANEGAMAAEGLGEVLGIPEAGMADLAVATGMSVEQLAILGEAAEDVTKRWTDLAGQFLDASQAMTRAEDDNRAAAEEAADAHNAAIDRRIAKLGEGKKKQREALEDQKKSWEDFEQAVTIDQIVDNLNDINQEFVDWRDNIETIAGRAGGYVADKLAMMGPEWAPIVAQAVDATAAELAALDQAMADNIDLQVAAAELAVQMEILEELVRQRGSRVGEELVHAVADGVGMDDLDFVRDTLQAAGALDIEVTVDADITPAQRSLLEAEGELDEFDRLVAIATADADIDPATRNIAAVMGFAHEWDESAAEATALLDIDGVVREWLEGRDLLDEWDALEARAQLDADGAAALAAVRQMQGMGDNWSDSRYESTLDADPDDAETSIAGVNALAFTWDTSTWTAALEAADTSARTTVMSLLDWIAEKFRNPFSFVVDVFARGRAEGVGDGPGAGGGGAATARARQAMQGLPVRISSTYRSPAHNRRVGGSPTSYHMDRNNPATDIAGPTWALDIVHNRLRKMGGNRELIWRAPGHWDHVHVAHSGATVDPSWPSVPGLRADERPAVLQVGEEVLAKREAQAYRQAIAQVPRYHDGTLGLAGQLAAGALGRTSTGLSNDLIRLESAVDRWTQGLEVEERRRRQRELKQAVKDARRDAERATDSDERKRAREREADASATYARWLEEQAIAAEKAAIEIQKLRLEEELRIAQNRDSWRFDRMSTSQQLADLGRRMQALRQWTDEWSQLDQQRSQILQSLVSEAQRAYDDEMAALNRMLDERQQAYERHEQAVTQVRERAADAERAAVERRTDQLRQALSLDLTDAWAHSASSITRQLQQQQQDLADHAVALAEARARGLSDEAIDLLGLADGPHQLEQLKVLLRSSDAELAEMSETVADRNAALALQVEREMGQAHSALGRELADIRTTLDDDLREAGLELQGALAGIGKDAGRSFAQAIQEGLSSGVASIVKQVGAAQKAMQGLSTAEARAAAPAPSIDQQIRDAFARAGVSIAVPWETGGRRLARLVEEVRSGQRTVADIERSARIQYQQHPATRLHDGGLVNLPRSQERIAVLRGQEVVQDVREVVGGAGSGPQVLVVEKTVEKMPDGPYALQLEDGTLLTGKLVQVADSQIAKHVNEQRREQTSRDRGGRS